MLFVCVLLLRFPVLQEMTVIFKAAGNDSLMSNISEEQAYEISPYKVSDDEDEDDEDDDKENNKFIPSWARYATQFCYLDRNAFNAIRLLIHIEYYACICSSAVSTRCFLSIDLSALGTTAIDEMTIAIFL